MQVFQYCGGISTEPPWVLPYYNSYVSPFINATAIHTNVHTCKYVLSYVAYNSNGSCCICAVMLTLCIYNICLLGQVCSLAHIATTVHVSPLFLAKVKSPLHCYKTHIHAVYIMYINFEMTKQMFVARLMKSFFQRKLAASCGRCIRVLL